MRLYQRDEFNASRDTLSHPPIPAADLFQYSGVEGPFWQKPVAVHGWDWSVTFGCWSALVTFPNGWKGWTYPKPDDTFSEV